MYQQKDANLSGLLSSRDNRIFQLYPKTILLRGLLLLSSMGDVYLYIRFIC